MASPFPPYYYPSGHSYAAHYANQVDALFNTAPVVYRDITVPAPGILTPPSYPGYQSSQPHQEKLLPRARALPPALAPPSITSHDRKWLFDTLKRNLFSNEGILAGGLLCDEIRYENVRNQFITRINELYPPSQYSITTDWLNYAFASLDYLPDISLSARIHPSLVENCKFISVINQVNYRAYMQSIATNIEPYFAISVESNEVLESNLAFAVNKVVLGFRNYLIHEPQFVTVYVVPELDIPYPLLEYQHDFITHNGREYSVLPSYYAAITPATPKNETSNRSHNHNRHESIARNDEIDIDIDKSITLFEMINNIRNCVYVIMPHVNVDDIKNQIKKFGKNGCLFGEVMLDKIITPRVKLDYYISQFMSINASAVVSGNKTCCARCKVVIDAGDMVCSTKCCRRTMHPSCLLELYINDDTPHATFKCDKCQIKRLDKQGRNTEILMGMSGLGF